MASFRAASLEFSDFRHSKLLGFASTATRPPAPTLPRWRAHSRRVCDSPGCDFGDARLTSAAFDGAELYFASFAGARLPSSTMARAQLQDAAPEGGGGYELLIDISELYCAAFIDGRWTAGRGVRRRQPQRGGFARVGLHARLDATRVCTLARVTEEASVRHSSVVSRRERVVADLWRGSKTRSSALDSPRDPPRLTRDRHARLVCPRNLQPRQPRRSKLRKGGADTLLIEP